MADAVNPQRFADVVDVNSKTFWTNYVTNAQHDAGAWLRANSASGTLRTAAAPNEARWQALNNPQNRVINLGTYRPVTVTYAPINFDCCNTTNIDINQTSAEQTQEQRDQESAALAICIGAVVSGIFAFIATYTWKLYSSYAETLSNTETLRHAIRDWNGADQPLVKREIYQLVQEQLAIDALNAARIQKYAIAAIAALIAGVVLVVGGFLALPVLITAGYITLLVAGLVAAGTLGWHWDDTATIERHYRAIAVDRTPDAAPQPLTDRILRQLQSRLIADNMQPVNQGVNVQDEEPPQYESLYPTFATYADTHPSAPPLEESTERPNAPPPEYKSAV